MKNREKWRGEVIKGDIEDFCEDFIAPVILKYFGMECINANCHQCQMLQMLWLEEEYQEPEVDWNKVEVDTPILVREFDNMDWAKRYFAKYKNGKVYTWDCGRTSWTIENKRLVTDWKQAKLAEVDRDEK